MALIFENSKEFQDNKYTIPKQTGNYFKAQAELLKSQDPHSAIPGHRIVDRLKNDGKAYNEKGSKKNGERQEAATLSANDAKVIKHRMKASLNTNGVNSTKNRIYASEVGKTIEKVCDDAISTAKRKSMQVQAVKPVKPNAAASTKPAMITKTKEISVPNGKISYTITAENKKTKKIYISENTLATLYEHHLELNIPFNDTTGKGYDDKYNYQHLYDWLEEIGRYGTLGNSKTDINGIREMMRDNMEEGFSLFMRFSDYNGDSYFLEDVMDKFNNLVTDEYDINYYFEEPDKFIKLFKNSKGTHTICELIEYFIGNITDADEIESFLNDKGKKELEKIKREVFADNINDNGVPYDFKFDNRGLVYIERTITIPKIFGTSYKNTSVSKDNNETFYDLLKREYKGIGNCWTWVEGNGEAYHAMDYAGEYSDITFKGWVDPANINWAQTLYRNAWELANEEKEIYISQGVPVELDSVIVGYSSHGTNKDSIDKNILNKPMVINT